MKILIVTKNWIGDVIFQSPAIQALRDHFPDAEIVCMAPPRCLEALRAHPAVDRLIEFDERSAQRSWFARLRFVWQLRRETWDRAYLFHRSKTRALLLRLAGVKALIGFGRGRRFLLTRAYPEPSAAVHHADQMLWLLRQDGIRVPQRAVYRFYYSQAARESALDLLRRHQLEEGRFVCFHLGANWEPKRWPVSHFAALADLIEERFHCPVVVTGHAKDQALWTAFEKGVSKARVIPLMGKTSLEELAALLRRAAFFVTGDSGPMHIAAGAGARVLALFGPTDPRRTGPRGPGDSVVLDFVPEGFQTPWYGTQMPQGGWLSRISPLKVLEAVAQKGWGCEMKPEGEEPLSCKTAMTAEERRVKKILWVTLSNIGDVILTTPVLRSLAGRFPEAEITAVAGPRARSVLEQSRPIRRIVTYNKRGGPLEQWRFLQELRRETYDLVVDLRNTAIPFLVKTRRRSPLVRRHTAVSMRDRHLEVLSMMGICPGPMPVFEFFHSGNAGTLEAKLSQKGISGSKGYVLLAPVAASGLKTWPLQGFETVLRRLLAVTADPVLIVGDQRERAMAESLTTVDPQRVVNLAGETTLPETAALVARARLIAANDSALMHLAFELGTPAVAVFGPTSHLKYGHTGEFFKIVRAGSPCSPCEKPRCRFERQHCFADLKPESVAQACEELLHDFCPSR